MLSHTYKHTKQRNIHTHTNVCTLWIYLYSSKWWEYQGCICMSKFIKRYTLNIFSYFLYPLHLQKTVKKKKKSLNPVSTVSMTLGSGKDYSCWNCLLLFAVGLNFWTIRIIINLVKEKKNVYFWKITDGRKWGWMLRRYFWYHRKLHFSLSTWSFHQIVGWAKYLGLSRLVNAWCTIHIIYCGGSQSLYLQSS